MGVRNMALMDFIVIKSLQTNGTDNPLLTLFFYQQLKDNLENGLIRRERIQWNSLYLKFHTEFYTKDQKRAASGEGSSNT